MKQVRPAFGKPDQLTGLLQDRLTIEDRTRGLHSGPARFDALYIRPFIDSQSDLVSIRDTNWQPWEKRLSIKLLDLWGSPYSLS